MSCFLLISVFFFSLWTTTAFQGLQGRRTLHHTTIPLLHGYVAPENDPQFQGSVKPSLLSSRSSLTDDVLLPNPKEGDIVQYPSKWKGEFDVGRLKNMFYSQESEQWFADITPLIDGKSENVRNIDRKVKSIVEPLDNVQPIQSYFIRSENGYKVFYKKNSTEMVLKAPKYAKLDENFVFKLKTYNATVVARDLDEYNQLKSRVIKGTLILGSIGALASLALYGPEVSIPYLGGAIAGALYFILLGKKTDSITQGVGLIGVQGNNLDNNLGNLRLLVPILLTTSIALGNYVTEDKAFSLFQMLSKEQYLGAMFGFLSYFYSILYFEVGRELSSDDLLGFLPGSISEGLKMKRAKENVTETEPIKLKRILFITGPRAAGREILSKKLINKMNIKKSGDEKSSQVLQTRDLNLVKLITTNSKVAESDPSRYIFLNELELTQLKELGDIIYEGTEFGLFGESWKVAVSVEQIEISTASSSDNDSLSVLQGPPEVLEGLKKMSGYRLSNMWISMQTKEQFIERASEQVRAEVTKNPEIYKGKENLAKMGADEVATLVNEAARDVSYFMAQAPLFEFTILADGDYDDTVDEISQILNPIL